MNTQIITKGKFVAAVETNSAALTISKTAQNLMANEMDTLIDNLPLMYTVMEIGLNSRQLLSPVMSVTNTQDGLLINVTDAEYVGSVAAIHSEFDANLDALDDRYLYYVNVGAK